MQQILKRTSELEKTLLERQRQKQTRVPQDFLEFCQRMLNLKLTGYPQEAAQLLKETENIRGREKRSSFIKHLIKLGLEKYKTENRLINA